MHALDIVWITNFLICRKQSPRKSRLMTISNQPSTDLYSLSQSISYIERLIDFVPANSCLGMAGESRCCFVGQTDEICGKGGKYCRMLAWPGDPVYIVRFIFSAL